MGGGDSKPQPKPTIDDVILDMRMTAKRFEMDAARAEREKKKQIDKARAAIKKNNDEGAKMFLNIAATKQKESATLLRMAHKMEALTTTIKGNTSSTHMLDQLNKITPLMNMQAQNIPPEKLYQDMQTFEKSMDDIMVQGKIMDQVLNNNTMDSNQDLAVDNLLNQMKKEVYNEVVNDLNNNNQMLFNELQNPNQLNQKNQNQQLQNDLKKM